MQLFYIYKQNNLYRHRLQIRAIEYRNHFFEITQWRIQSFFVPLSAYQLFFERQFLFRINE